VEIWAFAVLFAAGLTAIVRHSNFVARTRPRLRGFEPGRFERFWSRRDGRLLAIAWLALFVAAWLAPFAIGFGDADSRSAQFANELHPIRYPLLLAVQSVAAVLLVPLTAGLYLYKRAIPQIALDEADERERLVQGDVYRRTHTIIIVGLAIGGMLLVLDPDAGAYLRAETYSQGLGWVDLLLPIWVPLFMLPSIAYAWMYPRRDEGADGQLRRTMTR
jgi:hypothetical protein